MLLSFKTPQQLLSQQDAHECMCFMETNQSFPDSALAFSSRLSSSAWPLRRAWRTPVTCSAHRKVQGQPQASARHSATLLRMILSPFEMQMRSCSNIYEARKVRPAASMFLWIPRRRLPRRLAVHAADSIGRKPLPIALRLHAVPDALATPGVAPTGLSIGTSLTYDGSSQLVVFGGLF